MCSHQEWESFARRFEDAGAGHEVREFVADVATRIEAFVEDLMGRACVTEDEEWVRGCRRRSRTDWVA